MVSGISKILSFDTSVILWYSSKVKYSSEKVAYNLMIVFVKGLQDFLSKLGLRDLDWGYGDSTTGSPVNSQSF